MNIKINTQQNILSKVYMEKSWVMNTPISEVIRRLCLGFQKARRYVIAAFIHILQLKNVSIQFKEGDLSPNDVLDNPDLLRIMIKIYHDIQKLFREEGYVLYDGSTLRRSIVKGIFQDSLYTLIEEDTHLYRWGWYCYGCGNKRMVNFDCCDHMSCSSVGREQWNMHAIRYSIKHVDV